MKFKYLLITVLLGVCVNANAEWFLRGTQTIPAWAATQMVSAGAGTNTMQLNSVSFVAAGSIKFDRFGDWAENYGVNGRSGANIPVSVGTWDIKFFTDTKNWSITPSAPEVNFHIRGTFNAWAEGGLMTRVGTTATYESCINFVGGDVGGNPRFKIDPNGAWGDAVPATDFVVFPGWVKVTFDSSAIASASSGITVAQNLATNCGSTVSSSSVASASIASSVVSSSAVVSSVVSSSSEVNSAVSSSSEVSSSVASSSSVPAVKIYIRGTFNAWAQDTLMTQLGTSKVHESCINFINGDMGGTTRFKIDPNGGWGGDAVPGGDFNVAAGWVKITFNRDTNAISVVERLAANCPIASSSSATSSVVFSSSSSSASSKPFAHTFKTLNLRQSSNIWGVQPMTLIADNVWEGISGTQRSSANQLKFDVAGDWSFNFGDNLPIDGLGDQNGANIFVAGCANFDCTSVKVRFNDSTRQYALCYNSQFHPDTGTTSLCGL